MYDVRSSLHEPDWSAGFVLRRNRRTGRAGAEKTSLNRMSAAKVPGGTDRTGTRWGVNFWQGKDLLFCQPPGPGSDLPAAIFRMYMPLHYAITDSSLTIPPAR